ncbi:MAG: HAMP domain-containing sensor histidine kinase [Gammaproteobacteria bacterium]
MTSLRSKILASYGLSKAALVIFVAVVIADLHYLQTHITEGVAVSDLYLATQEIRRVEKNLFLYQDPHHLNQLKMQLDVAKNALATGERAFAVIAGQEELRRIGSALQKYSDQLEAYNLLSRAERTASQENIRATGHQLSLLTQGLNQRQRDILTDTTRVAARTLMVASVTVIMIGLISAMFMVRRVVRPLAQLENQLDQLAEGRVQTLALPSSDKEIASFVFHFNSMLEQLRNQQNLLRRHERAAALGVLVSGVAHELNNPLSNISTSVQLLLEEDGRARENLCKQWLSHIDGETERARRIVRRLLDTVRQPTHDMQLLGAASLVRSAVLLIHRLLPHDIFLHIEDISESMLMVDRDRMQQVIINLIRNSAHAGAKNVWITGRETTWKESKPVNTNHLAGDTTGIAQFTHILLMQVDDDGPGIPPDNLPKLFDPFFTTQSGGEGTGLGLYLVEEIINEHQGCIAVDNRPEGGARFTIWLPLQEVPVREHEEA